MNITINDAINEYYKLKETYEKTYYDKFIVPIIKTKDKSNKEKRVQYSKLPKPECINCKRNVGTIFSMKFIPEQFFKTFSIKCGDIKEPCPLNINFNYAERQTFEYNISLQQESLNKIKKDIILEKNNTLFNYLSESEAMTIFDTLTEKLKDVSELFGYAVEKNILQNDNPAKLGLLKEKQEEFNKIYLTQFKSLLSEYKNKNKDELLLDAVKYYMNEMIPLINEIRSLKYEVNEVEYDEINNKYYLIQKKNSLQSKEIYMEDDDKIIDFTKGTKKITTSKTLKVKQTRPSKKTQKKRSKTTITLIEDEEEEEKEL
jgi:hypothetical protein